MDIIPIVPEMVGIGVQGGPGRLGFYDKDGRLIGQVIIEAQPGMQQISIPPGATRAVWVSGPSPAANGGGDERTR